MTTDRRGNGMHLHDDWATPAFDLDPVASHTGPFPRRALLRAWWEHCRPAGAELLLADTGDALVQLYRHDGRLEFLGDPALTDYHSPLGTQVPAAVAKLAAALPEGTPFRFDSMPQEAADAVAAGLAEAGVRAEPERHEMTAVLDLPDDPERYLATLDKRQRHEVRRKRRRFESMRGTPLLDRVEGSEAVETFVAMHRRAEGEKGRFMSETRARFFAALHHDVGAVIDVLRDSEGRAVAAGFGFEDAAGYFFYNSAYEPEAAPASPGIVLVNLLIDDAIRRGLRRFDFLKGDEAYKSRLGARPRPLSRIDGVCGGGA